MAVAPGELSERYDGVSSARHRLMASCGVAGRFPVNRYVYDPFLRFSDVGAHSSVLDGQMGSSTAGLSYDRFCLELKSIDRFVSLYF